MENAPSFALNAATLTVIGALIGSLAGAISFLFRQLVAAKDVHIAGVTREMEQQRAVLLAQIEALKSDRDYFREMALRDRGLGRSDDDAGGAPGVRRVR